MEKRISGILAGILLAFFLGWAALPALHADTKVKVAVLPFAMNAEKDLGYLQEGIMDMLASRLYWEGKVEVIEKGRVREAMAGHKGNLNLEAASGFGRRLGADYVLFGSLTVFGESVSLDATMAGLTRQQLPETVFVQTQGMETVIPEINRFAQKVNAKIFGRPYQETDAAYASRPEPRQPADTGASALNPQFRKSQQVELQGGGGFWKSRRIEAEIRAMDIGDVDGDGRNELVMAEGVELHVYRFEKGSLKRLASHKSEDRHRFLSVDLADINKNGRAEIFASRFNEATTTVNSMVYELKGSEMVPVVKDSPWFYRVMDWPGKGTILAGQQKGRPGDVGGEGSSVIRDFFDRKIQQLTWNGSDYVAAGGEALMDLSDRAFSPLYIYNFTLGDVSGDGTSEIVYIDQNDRLNLLEAQGELLQRTSEYYGGTLNFIITNPNWDDSKSRSIRKNYLFIPARILIADLDGDGKNEIIINQNKSSTFGLTNRFKAFSDGKVVSVSWNGIALQPNWESRQINGCLSDYKIKDLDGDGRADLVVAMLQERGGSVFLKAKSLVVSYQLETGKAGGGAAARPASGGGG